MLRNLRSSLHRLQLDEMGATLTEYTILIGLVTLGAIGLIIGVGDTTEDKWRELSAELDDDGGNEGDSGNNGSSSSKGHETYLD